MFGRFVLGNWCFVLLCYVLRVCVVGSCIGCFVFGLQVGVPLRRGLDCLVSDCVVVRF